MAKTEGSVQLPSDLGNTGQLSHVRVVSISGIDYIEQVYQLADADNNAVARVLTADPAGGDAGLAVRVVPATAAPTRGSGSSAAPSASAVIADTGALAAGTYLIEFQLAAMDTLAVGKGMVIEHRNAANSATLNQLGGCVAGGSESGTIMRLTVAINERVRVIAGSAAGAASSLYVAHVAAYLLG